MGMDKSGSGGDAASGSLIQPAWEPWAAGHATRYIIKGLGEPCSMVSDWLLKEKTVTGVCSMGTAFLGG